MVAALIREIEIREALHNETIETIYFGGGTPSLLLPADIASIIGAIHKKYTVNAAAEITLEANPDDISRPQLISWKQEGINRLSIGIQSFRDADLQWMNRAHNVEQAWHSVEWAFQAGFDNFSIDLIFGTPGLSNMEWQNNIQKAIELNVRHISAYALTVEPKTPLDKMIRLKKKENIDAAGQAEQFLTLIAMLKNAGYEHYEISNFAKPGYRSRHNSSYWQGEKYIGIGPSAHSYDGVTRSWNVSNNVRYIQSLQDNRLPSQEEILTKSQKLNEHVMTSLRTTEGIDLQFIASNFSEMEKNRIVNVLQSKIPKHHFSFTNERIVLTDEGKLFADGIAAELFV